MKICSIKDVAKKACVSIATVSRVLSNSSYPVSEKTRKKVEDVVKELNYIPNTSAQNLRTRKTYVIGLLVRDIGNPYFGEMARAVTETAMKYNFLSMVFNSMRDRVYEFKYYDLMFRQPIDGLIIAGGAYLDDLSKEILRENIEMLKARGVKIIALAPQGLTVPTVSVNNRAVGEMITTYLIKHNHQKIAFIGGNELHATDAERIKGYKDALIKNGLTIYEELIIKKDFTWEGGYSCCKKLLKKNCEFTAIYCANDNIAVGVLRALQEAGINVPKQISVIGSGDISPSMYTTPRLTTVQFPFYELGKKAVELIVAKDDLENFKLYYDVKLVERDSVAFRK